MKERDDEVTEFVPVARVQTLLLQHGSEYADGC